MSRQSTVSQTIRAAAEFCLADHLADGPLSADEVAQDDGVGLALIDVGHPFPVDLAILQSPIRLRSAGWPNPPKSLLSPCSYCPQTPPTSQARPSRPPEDGSSTSASHVAPLTISLM